MHTDHKLTSVSVGSASCTWHPLQASSLALRFTQLAKQDATGKTVQAYTDAIQKQQGFSLIVKGKAGKVTACSNLVLEFRSANRSNIRKDMEAVGIPANLDNALPEESTCYYYVTLTDGGHSTDSSRASNSVSTSGNSFSMSKLFSLVEDNTAAFGDVRLGTILGHGQFGRVYRWARPTPC